MNTVPWECDYIASENSRIFRAYASSRSQTADVLVICNPLGEEAKAAFAVLTEFSQTLWQAGWGIARFDYSGTGDSEGRFEQCGPKDWLNDGLAVLDDIRRLGKGRRVVLMGVRLGANVAAALAKLLPDERRPLALVLWEPVLSIKEYRRHLNWIDREPDSCTHVDIMGWKISEQRLDEIEHTLDLGDTFPNCPVFVANISAGKTVSKQFAGLRSMLPDNARMTHVRSRPFWELIGRSKCEELVRETNEWLTIVRSWEIST